MIPQEIKPLISMLDQHYQDLKLKVRKTIDNFIISSAATADDLFAVDQKKQEPSIVKPTANLP
jgi:hypothetical protein